VQVLSVASEVYPLIKTGGLADVAGALPAALKPLSVEIITLLPGYPAVMKAVEAPEIVHVFNELFGGPARVLRGKAKGLSVLVLDAPHLYDRPGNPYLGPDGKDWPDNAQRFAGLSKAAAALARGEAKGFVADVVHLHDWQAGLTAAYLKYSGGPPAVITVHNLAFQGHFPASVFGSLDLPLEAFGIGGVEYYGGVGYLKAGLALADAITTVSPTYAREIQTAQDGMGLDGLLRMRSAVVSGILNGIDTTVWNPQTDAALTQTYDAKDLVKRNTNKRAIEKQFSLVQDDGLMFCIVSRLTDQKGMDLVLAGIDEMVAQGARLAVLGSGDPALESGFKAAVLRHSGRVGIVTGYNEPLSHLLQGGADSILIPSRFEPCGLTQLYGLRYGCVPLVSRFGGLADTVIDANEAAVAAGTATGVVFAPVAQTAFDEAVTRAVQLFKDRETWAGIQRAGMAADVSWTRSAKRYAALYKSVLKAK
jgi:starch synthase